jgi:hypothetical protein
MRRGGSAWGETGASKSRAKDRYRSPVAYHGGIHRQFGCMISLPALIVC